MNCKSLYSILFFFAAFFSSCAIKIIKNAPKDKPILVENSIEVKGGNFTTLEREAIVLRMESQLADSAKVKISSPVFFIDIIKKPIAYDTGYSSLSVKNMQASMRALGYYNAKVLYSADTLAARKVKVNYIMEAGNPTLIDTMAYRLSVPGLQQLAIKNPKQRIVQQNNPVTKAAVLGEIGRLVDTFRNNGYYKISGAELRMLGDTTIAALTQIADDPFEQLALLAEAQLARDSPTIKLQMILNPTEDTSKLQPYTINNIFVLEDFRPGDDIYNKTLTTDSGKQNDLIIKYHKKYIRSAFLRRNIVFKKGSLYSQEEYYKTITRLNKAGIWERINIRTEETDSNKLNMILELLPAKKFGFETNLEVSYSATSLSSNPLGSNLFGVAANISLSNRNIAKRAIHMTHTLRAGLELSSGNGRSKGASIVNSNELTYTNNIVFPSRIYPTRPIIFRDKPGESFITSRVSSIKRIGLFSLNSFSINFGTTINIGPQKKLIIRPFNAELNYLNRTDSFNKIIALNPFLRYSYTSSFILGTGATYTSVYNNPYHPKSLSKERSFKVNFEESGITIGMLPILKRYKSNYIKGDAEYKYTVTKSKSAIVFRVFGGVGIPLARDSSLPFFKQYFGGGSNSMRAWPIRGIGRGSQPRPPFGTIFNDRTGDIQFESNIEYRYDIARIIPNTLTLRGAVFTDIGNVWNFNSSIANAEDPAQFKFNKFYKELGVDVGTGFRLDFNYAIVRIDLGFRIKRPELSNINSGWKLPPVGFGDLFPKLFTRGKNDENRIWRYDNFNLTFGINYPF